MAETNKTITDIIAERRRQAEEIERVCADEIKRGVLVSEQFAAGIRDLVADIRQEADRLEAAWKREKAAIEADALAVGGLVEASRATVENSSAVGDAAHRRELSKNTSKNGVDFGQLGNGAKMRKALLFVKQYFDKIDPFNIETYTFAQIEVDYIKAAISAALSAPPRNCDVMSLAVAKKVWYIKEIMPRLNGDLPLGKEIPFEEWFVAPAAEKEGGEK